MKRLPLPSSLSTLTVPRCSSTSDRTIERPRPVPPSPPPSASEALEHAVHLLRRHAGAVVGHRQHELAPLLADGHPHGPLVAGVAVGVGQQVGHDLARLTGVGQRARQRGGQVQVEVLAAAGQLRLHHPGHLAHHLGEVEQPRVHLHLARLQPRDVQQVVDQLDQAVGAGEDDLGELALATGQALGAHEQLGEALDRSERAAQLVGRGGHEIGLHALEPGALGDIPDRPHHPAARALSRRGDRQRAITVVAHDLAGQRLLERRQGLPLAVGHLVAEPQLRNHDRRAGVRRRHGAVVLHHHQPVPEALHGHRQALALLLQAMTRCLELFGHPVECSAEVAELFGPARLDALVQVAGGVAAGRGDQLVERAPDRDQQGADERHRSQQGQPTGDGGDQQRVAGLLARACACLATPLGLTGGEREVVAPSLPEGADQRRPRLSGARHRRQPPRAPLRCHPRPDQARARGVGPGQRSCLGGQPGERRGGAPARAPGAGVGPPQRLLFEHADRQQARRDRLELIAARQRLLVALPGLQQVSHRERGDQAQHEGQPEQGQGERAAEGKARTLGGSAIYHLGMTWAREAAGGPPPPWSRRLRCWQEHSWSPSAARARTRSSRSPSSPAVPTCRSRQ